MAKVCVHLATGFEELEAITMLDVLRRADIAVLMVSMTKEMNVTSVHGLTVLADILFEDVDYENVDMIVLPGGMPGSTNLAAHEGLKQRISQFANQGKYLAAICAAPIVYGQMGLLKGKAAICYPGFEKNLDGAEIATERVVQTQNFITSKGPGTSLEFSFKLVEILKDKDTAEKIRTAMLA
ncbi:MAG: thiamine biosynthesis protein ThiJ [Peptococcaceae bacterium BRH_c4b]|nr:MAG: thiamine biosynthesis protein ThiJ [Peptococcaceae bacterium BRH_c4b]